MIDRVKYPFSYWVNVLVADGKLENPCQIDPITDIDTAANRLMNPMTFAERLPKEKVYILNFPTQTNAPFAVKDLVWDAITKIQTIELPNKKEIGGRVGDFDVAKENQRFATLVNTILNVLQSSADATKFMIETWKKIAYDEVQNECATYSRTNVVYTPVLGENYVIQFTDPLLRDRGATLQSISGPIREQIAPAFLDYENSLRRLTALRRQESIIKDDISIYDDRILKIEEFINRDSTDAWDTLITNYGSTCTPLLAKINGVYEQGTMERTGVGQKWGGNRNWNDAWWCRKELGMPPYTATQKEAIADAGSQESIRGQQRDMVRERLFLFKTEKNKLNALVKNLIDVEIPKQEKIVEATTKRWNETQKAVVDFLSKIADAQKTAAEADNYAAILEANRQIALAEEETKRKLEQIAAKEREDKRRSQTLMVIAGAAIGLSLLSRSQQGGSVTGNLISIGALGLLGYGAYTYWKTSETQVVVSDDESSEPSPDATATRNYIRQKLSMPFVKETVVPNQSTRDIVDTMVNPNTGRAIDRTASRNFSDGFLPY